MVESEQPSKLILPQPTNQENREVNIHIYTLRDLTNNVDVDFPLADAPNWKNNLR